MDDTAKLQTVTDYLRLAYAANVNGLRTKIQEVAQNSALAFVTITGDSFEGGSNHGELTLHPLLFLRGAMDVLAELDPASVPTPPARGALTDFRSVIVGT